MQNFRILYLDNNRFIAEQVKMRLEWNGYQVAITDSEQELINKIHRQENDLLIIDFLTPALDAFSLLEDLKQQNIQLPTIVVSDDKDDKQATRAMHLGCMDFIVKNSLVQTYFDQISLSIFQAFEQLDYQKTATARQETLPCFSSKLNSSTQTRNWEYFPAQDIVQHSFATSEGKVTLAYDKFTAKIHVDDVALVKVQNNICLFAHKAVAYSFRYIPEKGREIMCQARISAEVDCYGVVTRLYGHLQQLDLPQSTEENQRIKLSFLDTCSDAVFITDAKRRIISVNKAFIRTIGYSEQAILKKSASILKAEKLDDSFYNEKAEELENKNYWQGEVLIRHRNGSFITMWQSCHILKDEAGKISQTISSLRDISKQKAYEESIKFQANYDPLTQLPNRSLFLDRLENAIKLSLRNNTKLAVMLLDLNKFKQTNDTLGHHAGDLLLQETAKKLQSAVRSTDTVARLGGDEFSIIVPELEKTTDAERIVRKILNAFKEPVQIYEQEIFISTCIGITIFPDDGTSLEAMQKNADSAMYMAKNNGQHSYYYTQAIQQETEKRLNLIEDMRVAIFNQEFSLHYQPIIDVKTKKVDSVEALLRWKHPKSGYIPLDEFIPIAEESGLIREIGNWVIEEVSRNIQRWIKSGLPVVRISLNQSVAQYKLAECHIEWLDILQNNHIPPESITFEISEKLFFQEKNNYLASVKKLKQEGIQISLDGFGTGYSSLSYLKKFPVDVIKIDRSYIHSMVDDPVNAVLVETIIILANKLGIKVIATGIESEEQLDMLDKKCRYAQGYYFSKPLPLNEFEAFIKVSNHA